MEMDPGTNVTVNGATFDPAIGDDIDNPDPTWRTELYLAPSWSLARARRDGNDRAHRAVVGQWLTYGDATQGLEPIVVEHKWIDRDGDGVRDLNELVRYDAENIRRRISIPAI
jgi:hypothetical protein